MLFFYKEYVYANQTFKLNGSSFVEFSPYSMYVQWFRQTTTATGGPILWTPRFNDVLVLFRIWNTYSVI